MTYGEMESMLQELEREQALYLEKTQQKLQGLRTEMERMKKGRSADQNSENTGIREYMLERARRYFDDAFLLPEDALEQVDWLYEVTNGKVKEEQVVFVVDESDYESQSITEIRAVIKQAFPQTSSEGCLLFFCEDRLIILEPDEGDDDVFCMAAMFKYKIIDRVFRFDDGLRIDVTENARQFEDYDGDLHRLPLMEAPIEKVLPKILLNMREYVQ